MATRRGPDNSVRVAIAGTNSGVNWANIFHAQLTTSSAIIQSDLDSWLNSFQADYKTRFAPFMYAGVAYSNAKAVCYTPGGTALLSSVTMTGAGSSGGTAVADNSLCYVVSWNTNVYWRGGKPRTYLPGISTAGMSSNTTLAGATQTSVQTAAGNFRTDINALAPGTITGSSLGFVSFSSGNVPRSPAVFFPVSGAKVHGRAGTQRRRMGKWQN